MADWTTLPNTAVGVGGLPSGTTVTALRDNPVAIAEGAAGAPRVQGIGMDTFIGRGAAVYTDLETAGAVVIHAQSSTGSLPQVSSDNGSTFDELRSTGSTSGGTTSVYYFNLNTGQWTQVRSDGAVFSGTISGGPFNAIELRGQGGFLHYIGRGDGL